MKKITQIYSKMGDLARQIDNLEQKIKDGNAHVKVVYSVGGVMLTTDKEIQYMIDLEWARIRDLEDVLVKSEKETRLYMQDLRDSMCKECNMNLKEGCQTDFLIVTLYKTLQEVLV